MKELIKIQSELNAPKSQKNTFWNYNYRSTEDIMSALKPLLLREECFLTVTDDIIQVGDRFYVKATATITKGEISVFTTAFAREPLERKWMDSAQVTGSTSSYARKYALSGLFAIDDEKDPDHSDNRKSEKLPQKKELGEYIDEIKSELDTNVIVTLAKEALELFKSEKQQEWIKREARQRTDYLNESVVDKFIPD